MKPEINNAAKSVTLYVELPAQNIGTLKFLIESYEGLGVIRTLQKRGVLVIFATIDTEPILKTLLKEVASDLSIKIVEGLRLSEEEVLE